MNALDIKQHNRYIAFVSNGQHENFQSHQADG